MIAFRLAQFVLLVAGVTVAAPCRAGAILDRMGGTWNGKGTVRNVDSAETERMACRLASGAPGKFGKTSLEGRCSTANAAANIVIEIEGRGGGTLTAVIATSVTPEQTHYLGQERGQTVALSSQWPIAIKNELYYSNIAIRFHGNDRFGMSHAVSHVRTGEKQILFSAEFTRSK